ncbi:MAG: twitching motility protein PilT [Desulfobacterales bacterium C00003060]|nr:MAG: twitching motility protein PilT [Desulfobacterales bacterium C00003060]
MNALAIVDTDVLIDAASQISKAIDCLDGLEQNSMLAISVITQMELFVGCRNKTELENTKRFLQRFQVLKLSDQISDKAIGLLLQYRLSHGLAIPDALIAATAITFNQPFISKNQRDYRFISELQLLPYPGPSKYCNESQ